MGGGGKRGGGHHHSHHIATHNHHHHHSHHNGPSPTQYYNLLAPTVFSRDISTQNGISLCAPSGLITYPITIAVIKTEVFGQQIQNVVGLEAVTASIASLLSGGNQSAILTSWPCGINDVSLPPIIMYPVDGVLKNITSIIYHIGEYSGDERYDEINLENLMLKYRRMSRETFQSLKKPWGDRTPQPEEVLAWIVNAVDPMHKQQMRLEISTWEKTWVTAKEEIVQESSSVCCRSICLGLCVCSLCVLAFYGSNLEHYYPVRVKWTKAQADFFGSNQINRFSGAYLILNLPGMFSPEPSAYGSAPAALNASEQTNTFTAMFSTEPSAYGSAPVALNAAQQKIAIDAFEMD